MDNNYEQTVKLWDDTTETLGKLSYIAAGTISLSITFLGYILSIGSSARSILLSQFIHGLPLINLLFLSWILLFLSMFLGIIVRLPNSRFLFNSHIHLCFNELANKTTSEIKNNLESVAKTALNEQDKYWMISKSVQYATIIFFALGILSLIIFAISLSYQLAMI